MNKEQLKEIVKLVEEGTHGRHIENGYFTHTDEGTGNSNEDLNNGTTIHFGTIKDFEKGFSFKEDIIENIENMEDK